MSGVSVCFSSPALMPATAAMGLTGTMVFTTCISGESVDAAFVASATRFSASSP